MRRLSVWTIALVSLIQCLLFGDVAYAIEETRYVNTNVLNVRLCPSASCPKTSELYRGNTVHVYEVRDGFARVSSYYDSASERMDHPGITERQVARWVSVEFLADTPPAPVEEVVADERYFDSRIQGIPRPGEYGLTEQDVLLIRRYAWGMISTRQCRRIDYADKSTTRANTFYVHCDDETRNRFFTARDVRDDW